MYLIIFFCLFVSKLNATSYRSCSLGTIRIWDQYYGYVCVPQYRSPTEDCIHCQRNQQPYNPYANWFSQFPPAIYQPVSQPWWAYQGNMYYPNMYYPGAWNNQSQYPGMHSNYYHGQGEVFAAKPNVYVESHHKNKKFSFEFLSKEKIHFLATTPILDQNMSWRGKITEGDRFEVDDVNYDYLFYDLRLPKEKMQFESGLCTSRADAIKWMLKDLEEMKYPAIALADFEEHWTVKIPNYPYYCIYPQYNNQLDALIPVGISIEGAKFIRSLYVLIPHKNEPNVLSPHSVSFPRSDSATIRPLAYAGRETIFKEWGVAFLGAE